MKRPTALIAALLVSTLSATACGDSGSKPLAEKTEEIEKVEKKTVEAMTFDVTSTGSKLTFAMEAPVEKQFGSVPEDALSGSVNFDLHDFTKSTGLVNVDISKLEIYQEVAAEDGTFGEREKSDLQNEHMRDWLEIGEDAPPEEAEKNRTIQFQLAEVKDVSAADVSAIQGTTRTVSFTGVGDFRLHQRTAKKEVKLEATFTYEGDVPTSVAVKSLAPVTVDLAEHDVRPRTGFGKLAEKTLGAMSPKVGKEAEVSVAFTANATKPAAGAAPTK